MRVYFDNAATTPLESRVADEMFEVMKNVYGNPSSLHQEGRKARTLVERARKTVAKLLDVAPGEIFFTSGGTEADNMAIRCVVNDLGITDIISSPIEHHAVLHSLERCKIDYNSRIHYVNLLEDGHIDLAHLSQLLKTAPNGKTLVSLMHANNEIGNLLDVEAVGKICKENNALFHCDMVQTIGHLSIKLKEWGVNFSAASAHKFNGPKGVGFFYLDSNVKIKPFIEGGAQERNMRGGTENIYGIVGLAKALEICYDELEQQKEYISGIRNYMYERLMENIPDVKFNGDYQGRTSYTVLSAAFPPNPNSEMLLFNLDIEGIAASGGSACTSGSNTGSHVISALPPKEGYTAIRFSFGKYNTREEVDFAIEKLKEILKLKTASGYKLQVSG